MLILLIENYM